jgi:hypothetical protein
MSASLTIKFPIAFSSQGEVFVRRFLRFLDEAVENQNPTLSDAEQHAGDPMAWKVAS